jgi:FkbM family methyltransferase
MIKSWLKQIFRNKIVEMEGVKIKVPQIASNVISKAIYDGSYEAMELKLLKNKISKDDIVLEIGTGLGLLSTYCAKKIGSDKIFTFEGNPALEKAIKDNYSLNQVTPDLKMCLVGSQSGFRTFYVGENFWSSSIFNKPKGAQPINVPVMSFNEVVRSINPTFLILDVEGGEYELVEYADFYNVRKLLIEIHSWLLSPEQVQFVKDKLMQKGFHLVESSGKEEFYFER